MNMHRIEDYIDRVYGYAVNHTYSREEADELSQEILFAAICELPRLRDESRFEPWLWSIARNVMNSFRRRMGRQRAMYSYNVPEEMCWDEQDGDALEEEYADLRARIAMLSSIYRNIVVLYYYDGLSVSQISAKLGIPEGTVTWRLSEARRKLKKECTEMKESALRPVKLNIDIYGSGSYNGVNIPFPSAYISDALSQNILHCCYEESRNVEELAKECGVPAYYVEERIANLLKREAVIETTKGRYQTDFIIWMDRHGAYCEENAEKVLSPMMESMMGALTRIARDAEKIDFYRAEKSEQDLFYLYGMMAFEYAGRQYCRTPYPKMERRYDGFEWRYIGSMETGKHHRLGIARQTNRNRDSRGNYDHFTYGRIGGIEFRRIMREDELNVCEDILREAKSADIDATARAIEGGYIVRKADGELFVTVPALTMAQKMEFDAIADSHLAPLMEEYNEALRRFATGYKRLFPAHLNDDVERMCHDLFIGMYPVAIEYAQRTGMVDRPSEGCHCDVMIQWRMK